MSVKITTQFSITIVVTIPVQGTLGHLLPRGNMAIWRESAAQPGVEDNYKSIC